MSRFALTTALSLSPARVAVATVVVLNQAGYPWRMANAADRARRLWKLYGLTLTDYDTLLVEQGGVCAICGNPPKEGGPSLSVDHDHAIVARVPKGKRTPELLRTSVRGLLCWLCNHRRIGRGATPTLMYSAGDYLRFSLARSQACLIPERSDAPTQS